MQAAKRAPAVSPLADGLMTAAVAVLVIVGIAPALWRYLLRSGGSSTSSALSPRRLHRQLCRAGSQSPTVLGCWAYKQALSATAMQQGLGASVALRPSHKEGLTTTMAYLPPIPTYRCRSAETHMALSEKLYAEYATL